MQLNPRDLVATPIVARMDELFAVDAEARRRVIGLTGRHALRQEIAKPLMDEIRERIEAAQSSALPSSALSNACHYALTLWKKLTRFLEYPELELSNNLAENSMRPVALGRKNWAKSRGDSLGRGKLPSVENLRSLLPGSDSSRTCRCHNPAPSRPYSRCVGRPAFYGVEPGLFEYEIESTWPSLV